DSPIFWVRPSRRTKIDPTPNIRNNIFLAELARVLISLPPKSCFGIPNEGASSMPTDWIDVPIMNGAPESYKQVTVPDFVNALLVDVTHICARMAAWSR